MSHCGRPGLWARALRLLGFRPDRLGVCADWYEEPPDAFVREPRRPRPLEPSGAITLALPGSE